MTTATIAQNTGSSQYLCKNAITGFVVEIDITHPSLDKLPICAQIGVPEVWRYDGDRLEILALEGDAYAAAPQSHIFPVVTAAALTALLPTGATVGDVAWMRQIRAWVQTLIA